MTSTRIYIIGAGAIARTHAAATQTLPEHASIVLSVADPMPSVMTAFADRFPHARVYDDAEQMLAEPAQPNDIVIVATPPFTHCALTCAALATGRHVLCEKPLAMDRAEAVQMLQTARQYNRFVGCCSTRLLELATNTYVRQLLATGSLGSLYHVRFIQRFRRQRSGIEYQPTSSWFLDRAKSGGGTLMDWSPYDFTTLNELLRPTHVEVLGAWLANPETTLHLSEGAVNDVEQHAGALLRYHLSDGSVVNVSHERAACTYGTPESTLEIEGLRGAVKWDWTTNKGGQVTYTCEQAGNVVSRTETLQEETIDVMHQPLHAFYQHIQGLPSSAIVNEQALFNFSCIQAIYACARSGQVQHVGWEESK